MITRLILACGFAAAGAVAVFPPMMRGPHESTSIRGCLFSENLHLVQQRTGNQIQFFSVDVDVTRWALELVAIVGLTGSCTAAASAVQLVWFARRAAARPADVPEPE